MSGEARLGRIAQIALPAADVGRATAFYRDTLGLTLMFEVAGMAFFDADGTRILIGPRFRDAPPAGDVILYFDAGADWSATENALAAKGVAFDRPADVVQQAEGKEHVFRLFKDPDGNQLAIMGWRSAG
jgi:catechol 2,3-dioxygenase-like lactoylglutathione lyase family enzyme